MGNYETNNIINYINIGICYCLEQNKSEGLLGINDFENNNLLEDIKIYNITNNSITEDSILYNDNKVINYQNISFEITDYFPKIFHFLRNIDFIEEDIIVRSFIPMLNKGTFEKSQGKSKDFFVHTHDNLFLIKTINLTDKEYFQNNFLLQYAKHIYYNNCSLLCRIFGLYKLKSNNFLYWNNEIYFVILRNLIGIFDPENIFVIYDLKGCNHDRKIFTEYNVLQKEILKDINFEEREEKSILVNNKDAEKIITILKKDTEFLSNCNIIDYSLFVSKICITKEDNKFIYKDDDLYDFQSQYIDYLNNKLYNLDLDFIDNEILIDLIEKNFRYKKNEKNTTNIENRDLSFNKSNLKFIKKNIFKSLEKDKIYVLGIIDYFQSYNINKIFESTYKRLLYGKDNISSVPPIDYKNRFLNFFKQCFDYNNILRQFSKIINKKKKSI